MTDKPLEIVWDCDSFSTGREMGYWWKYRYKVYPDGFASVKPAHKYVKHFRNKDELVLSPSNSGTIETAKQRCEEHRRNLKQ